MNSTRAVATENDLSARRIQSTTPPISSKFGKDRSSASNQDIARTDQKLDRAKAVRLAMQRTG